MNPGLPSGTQNSFFGQKVSKPGINVNNAGDNELIYKNDYTTTLYYDSEGIPTVLLGLRQSAGQQGLFVSDPGVDVTQATDSQLIFNSSQNIFKIVFEGTINIPSYSLASQVVWQTITVPHNLSYVPIMDVYAQVNYLTWPGGVGAGATVIPAYVSLPYNGNAVGSSSNADYYIDASIDNTNVYITYYYSATTISGPQTFPLTPVKYYLLQETSN